MNITVNWDVVLKGQIADPVQKVNTMKLLNGLHFSQSFDAAGKTVVTHRADTPAPNAKSQAGYDQIFTGIDQVITGFMDTYKLFMENPPFPAVNSEYVLEDFNNGYRLTYRENQSDVITYMTKTFVITETIVNAPDFTSSIRPSFLTTAEGYVLAGYDGDYKPTKTTTGVVKLSGTLEHGMVEGLRLPKKLYFDSSMDGAPSSTELTFAGYTVKKR